MKPAIIGEASYLVQVRDARTGEIQCVQVSLTEDEREDVSRNRHTCDAGGGGPVATTYARRHALAKIAEARGFEVHDVTRPHRGH